MVVQQTHPKREDSNRVKVIVSPVGRQGRPGTPGVSIRFFDTLQEALDLQPRPENGVTFQVREETDPENFGFYVFDDREPEGYRYLGERWDDEYLTQIENRIDAFEQDVEGQVQGLETRVESVETDVSGFKAEVEDRVEDVESDMSGFKTEVNQRVEDAENAVQSLQDTTARYAFDTLQEAQDKWASFSQEEKDDLVGKELVIGKKVHKWTSTGVSESIRDLSTADNAIEMLQMISDTFAEVGEEVDISEIVWEEGKRINRFGVVSDTLGALSASNFVDLPYDNLNYRYQGYLFGNEVSVSVYDENENFLASTTDEDVVDRYNFEFYAPLGAKKARFTCHNDYVDTFSVSIAENKITLKTDLTEMFLNERYGIENAVYNDDLILESAEVLWDDGTPGEVTMGDYNIDFMSYDSYEVSYIGEETRTIIQPKVTRDIDGNITKKPNLIII